MKAYAILDGGGVLGAALAGCLKAAEQLGVEFVGYAGTSAGSMVATLAAVGYAPDDLSRMMLHEVNFDEFLDDGGASLASLGRLFQRPTILGVVRRWGILRRAHRDLGLYHGARLQNFLLDKIRQKVKTDDPDAIDFEDLRKAGCKPLKVIASDVGLRRALVFGSAAYGGQNEQVVDAVRASVGYPFVFRPVRVNDRRLVDGGLCSNLPVFAFEKERRAANLPVVAFDLTSRPRHRSAGDGGLLRYCRDMITTSLESHDRIVRDRISGLHYVSVPVPDGIDALDFGISVRDREALFHAGMNTTYDYFTSRTPYWGLVTSQVERLQAARNIEPDRVGELLGVIARDVESLSFARDVRAAVMLPTGRETRIVAYQYKMDGDPDLDLEIATGAGCTGVSWSRRTVCFADLDEARADPSKWGMTRPQHNRVPARQKALVSVPLFDLAAPARSPRGERSLVDSLDLLGTLSLDTSTPLADTCWAENGSAQVALIERLKFWADIVSKALA